METQEVQSLVEDLDSNIDDLEQALAPVLKTALSASTSKLPLLDKAKLYVLATYAIESILFSALRLNGVDAKTHPVFQELTRVKEYFAKIKNTETAGAKRSTTVDKDAAGRFIKHGLAGNEKYDRERADRVTRERAGAKRKFEDMQERVGTHTRFEDTAKKTKMQEEAGEVDLVDSEAVVDGLEKKAAKKLRREKKRLAKLGQENGEASQAEHEAVDGSAGTTVETDSVNRVAHAPESHSAVLRELLEGSSPQAGDQQGGKKKRRRNRGQMMQNLENKRAEEML